jgi:hypothetical protein
LKKDIDDWRKKLRFSRINTGADQVQLLSLLKQMAKLLMQEDAYWRQREKKLIGIRKETEIQKKKMPLLLLEKR